MLEARERSRDAHLDNLGDLRRRSQADIAERVLARAVHFADRDRALLEAMYRDGRFAAELARLLRVPVRILRARIRRLIERAYSPLFTFVLRENAHWPPLRRRVALLHVLQGATLRATAGALRITFHQVRAHLAWMGMRVESQDPATQTARADAWEDRS